MPQTRLHRRKFIQTGLAGSAALLAGGSLPALAVTTRQPPITRKIPSREELLPVIGLGTNAFGVSTAEEQAQLREVLETMPTRGGTVIDTAEVYGRSEQVIGELLADIGNRERFFLATKTPMRDAIPDVERAIEERFEVLGVSTIDLLQVHNLHEIDRQVPYFVRARDSGRVRYIGASTSSSTQYEAFVQAMRRHPFDFIQVNYSIDDRAAADEILPLAQELGMGVLINMPLGGRRGAASTFARVANQALPAWADDIDAGSWAQIFLKYVVSHPAVTVAIPGTTRLRHLQDNQAAGHGRLPDAAMRRDIERWWDDLPS